MSQRAVVVIGGSIAGLMHALVIKSTGRNVILVEARSEQQIQVRAAGLSFWPNTQFLFVNHIPDINLDALATKNMTMELVNEHGVLMADVPIKDDVRTSNWSTVRKLLAKSCTEEIDGHGSVQIVWHTKVSKVVDHSDYIKVVCHGPSNVENTIITRLVIAADGAHSAVRRCMLPDVRPIYAGYLAWRGRLPESEAPKELEGTLEGKLTTFMLDGSYILSYIAPSENGSTIPGTRFVEWCWYDTCDRSSATFSKYMTDREGIQHNVTVPADKAHPEVWKAQLSRRDAVISPLWQKLFAISSTPLLTAIYSFENVKSSFFGGKLLLVGEAYTQVRPHLGASCDIAAMQALNLPRVLSGEMNICEWESMVAQHAKQKMISSEATGTFAMTGKWPDGYVPDYTQSDCFTS